MATGKDFVKRDIYLLIDWLAVPRKITLPTLIAIGLTIGQLLWIYIDSSKIFSWLSGLSSPFCMMCATVVWAMREKLDDTIDQDSMSASEYKSFVKLNNEHRNRSTQWAIFTGAMALISSFPAIADQLIGSVWHWMVLASCTAVASTIYPYLLAAYWERQAKNYVSQKKLEAKIKTEKRTLELLIGKSKNSNQPNKGWSNGPNIMA
ncbi:MULTISPECIES: hypothetical protein [Giesbergeria]|uniref:Uncharacterized protein n=1 Tax=Giesbergeria sinuosa TaxID=80883 RepID=A0ABV9QCT2_9BURK